MEKVHEFEFLNAEECSFWLSTVMSCQHLFAGNPNSMQFLGYPTYIYENQRASLIEKIHEVNQILDQKFAELQNKVQRFFENLLHVPIFFPEKFSRPGFHIIKVSPNGHFAPYFHFDHQTQCLWSHVPEIQNRQCQYDLSFTVLISSQVEAVGLRLIYNLTPKLLSFLQPADTDYSHHERLLPKSVPLTYKRGNLYHHKNILHSIWCENHTDQTYLRVSYQGHLVVFPDCAYMFW